MLSFTQMVPDSERPPRASDEALCVPATWYVQGKVAFDFALALTLLILTSPLILVSMLLVKLSSRGPIIYTQTRLGRGGQPFTIFKLRTMTHNCESLTGAAWSQPGDSRITPMGHFLRRTHLDELPQLWNVLRGDMSLIGPRPERPEFVPQLAQALPHYCERLQVRPGITGIAQVQLPPDSDLESVRLKLAYDLHYVRKVGLWFDLRICAATFFKMIGVRFHVLQAMFQFVGRPTIEREYQNLCATLPAPVVSSVPVASIAPAVHVEPVRVDAPHAEATQSS